MPERIVDIGKLHRSHVGLMLGQDNILGLQNPDDFSCNVDLYMAGHTSNRQRGLLLDTGLVTFSMNK